MKYFVLLFIIISGFSAQAQFDPNYRDTDEEKESPVNLGVGMGLSYGGLGGRLGFYPVKNFGVFAGIGYNLVKAGYNVGGIVRFRPQKKVSPFLTGMYGYNAVIVVAGAKNYNEVYFGPTFGGGIELHFSNKQNFMNFELLVPVRAQEFYDDMDVLRSNPAIEVSDPLPFTFSVGYHIRLGL